MPRGGLVAAEARQVRRDGAAGAADARECVVELEPPAGGRARTRVAGVTAHEVAAIAAALLNNRA
ncbi:MAG TPA: hypothetical protein VJJ77_06025 [Dongiaceae bacterium]|nr:hypothetical protein [Dongiaceae bacterium]